MFLKYFTLIFLRFYSILPESRLYLKEGFHNLQYTQRHHFALHLKDGFHSWLTFTRYNNFIYARKLAISNRCFQISLTLLPCACLNIPLRHHFALHLKPEFHSWPTSTRYNNFINARKFAISNSCFQISLVLLLPCVCLNIPLRHHFALYLKADFHSWSTSKQYNNFIFARKLAILNSRFQISLVLLPCVCLNIPLRHHFALHLKADFHSWPTSTRYNNFIYARKLAILNSRFQISLVLLSCVCLNIPLKHHFALHLKADFHSWPTSTRYNNFIYARKLVISNSRFQISLVLLPCVCLNIPLRHNFALHLKADFHSWPTSTRYNNFIYARKLAILNSRFQISLVLLPCVCLNIPLRHHFALHLKADFHSWPTSTRYNNFIYARKLVISNSCFQISLVLLPCVCLNIPLRHNFALHLKAYFHSWPTSTRYNNFIYARKLAILNSRFQISLVLLPCVCLNIPLRHHFALHLKADFHSWPTSTRYNNFIYARKLVISNSRFQIFLVLLPCVCLNIPLRHNFALHLKADFHSWPTSTRYNNFIYARILAILNSRFQISLVLLPCVCLNIPLRHNFALHLKADFHSWPTSTRYNNFIYARKLAILNSRFQISLVLLPCVCLNIPLRHNFALHLKADFHSWPTSTRYNNFIYARKLAISNSRFQTSLVLLPFACLNMPLRHHFALHLIANFHSWLTSTRYNNFIYARK